jgi:hypothetical protein
MASQLAQVNPRSGGYFHMASVAFPHWQDVFKGCEQLELFCEQLS